MGQRHIDTCWGSAVLDGGLLPDGASGARLEPGSRLGR